MPADSRRRRCTLGRFKLRFKLRSSYLTRPERQLHLILADLQLLAQKCCLQTLLAHLLQTNINSVSQRIRSFACRIGPWVQNSTEVV